MMFSLVSDVLVKRNRSAGSVAYRLITSMVDSGVSAWPPAIMSRSSRKYCTYRSGVKEFSSTAGWSPGLAKVCGAPGGIITSVPAAASWVVSPTVKRAVPETT